MGRGKGVNVLNPVSVQVYGHEQGGGVVTNRKRALALMSQSYQVERQRVPAMLVTYAELYCTGLKFSETTRKLNSNRTVSGAEGRRGIGVNE